MRKLVLIAASVALLAGCSASVGFVGIWNFGDGSDAYGTISITNSLGSTTLFYIGSAQYGPVETGRSIVVQLRSGTWYVRDGFGHARYVELSSGDTVYVIFT